MLPELTTAVENAYRVFARYPLKGTVAVCRCPVCVDEASEKALSKTPIRKIPARLLAEYTHSAHFWDGQVEDDFRYFLPRYFELIASGDVPSNTGIETCLERMREAHYRKTWPKAEAAAIDAFFLARFRAALAEPVSPDAMGFVAEDCDAAEEILCMVAHAGGDIAPLLTTWDADRNRAAACHIANIVVSADWRKKKLRNSWWPMHGRADTVAAMEQVIAWLLRPQTCERLETACLAETNEGVEALLSHAEGIVRGLI